MFTESVSFPAAFLAGLLSFFSPCILPLIPVYFTFITGFSLEELTGTTARDVRRKVVLSTLAFVSGFAFVFVVLGASASFLGTLVFRYADTVRIVGAVFIILLGIHLTGLLRIPMLDVEKRIHLRKKPLHVFGTFLVGMAFGAGWSPCIGPLLGSILILAGSQETVSQGILLLAAYSAGMAIPFVVMSVFINFLLEIIRKASRLIRAINLAAGVLLVIVGIALAADRINIFRSLG